MVHHAKTPRRSLGCFFCAEWAMVFEIWRKLRSDLSEGPNSPMDCLAAKAATVDFITAGDFILVFYFIKAMEFEEKSDIR